MRQLLEHEGKNLASAAGVAVPLGHLAFTPEEIHRVATDLGGEVVLKAQVPIGGRGKAGGILVTPSGRAGEIGARLLGSTVRGYPVESVLVEKALSKSAELYVALTFDPVLKSAVLMMSAAGGVDVEHGAAEHIVVVPIPSDLGLRSWHVRDAADRIGLRPAQVPSLYETVEALHRVFVETRAVLVEVNPLFLTEGEEFVAGDVRVIPDPGAPAILGAKQTAPEEGSAATKQGFDLIMLDPQGQAGLITTGAGGTMLLLDLLSDAGVRPINFCDIRSGAPRGRQERFETAFRELRDMPNLRCILINIFAGVTFLIDLVPDILGALSRVPVQVPVYARLQGRGMHDARVALQAGGIDTPDRLEDLIDMARRASAQTVEGEMA